MQPALPGITERDAWSTACPDWADRLRTGRPLVPSLPLFAEEARRGVRAFGNLCVPDIAGMPFQRDVCAPWFMAIVEALFGSRDPESQRRMISEIFLLIPKKNAKSSNGGALMLAVLIVDEQPNQEFFLVAPTINIANIAFKQAVDTIMCDPVLKNLLKPRPHMRQIQNLRTGSVMAIRAADTEVITGGKQKGTLIDESHVFCQKPKAADLYTELRGAMATRRDGFLIQLTTQSKDEPSPQFRIELEKARAVRDGTLDYPLLPILYEFPEDVLDSEGWMDEANWGMVNPNLNRSVDLSFLRREFATAKAAGREHLALFASQHLNIEIGQRLRHGHWAGGRHWQAAAEPGLTLNAIVERSEVLTVGIDGGGLDDLFALGVVGRCRKTGDWLHWGHAWAQRDVLELRKDISPQLAAFAEAGELTLCDDMREDVSTIAAQIAELDATGLVPERGGIGIDVAAIGTLIDDLSDLGIAAERLTAVSQGWKLSSAIFTAERALKAMKLRHCGQGLMAFAVSNAKVEPAGNGVRITKQMAGRSKIDPLIALFNAVELMSRNPSASVAGRADDYFAALRAATQGEARA